VERSGREYGFAAAPVVNARDQYEDAHWQARGAVWRFDDPVYGDAVEYGPVPKLSASPGRLRWTGRPVGFDNQHIFRGLLGLSPARVAELEAHGTIRTWADRPGARPPADWRGEGLIARRLENHVNRS
jgi:crotonobetainyl-CoA:carnitine CoA-transferase CaiB-like acyl-CoA transferase